MTTIIYIWQMVEIMSILMGFAWEMPNTVSKLLEHPLYYFAFGCVDAFLSILAVEVIHQLIGGILIKTSWAFLILHFILLLVLSGTFYQLLFTEIMTDRKKIRHYFHAFFD
jgi:hypothetical protein